jgi:hypothetical protein
LLNRSFHYYLGKQNNNQIVRAGLNNPETLNLNSKQILINEITRHRKAYLQFFESKGHLIVPSAPIVLKDDPTLMFNNSGMAQFKEYFLGSA